MSKIKTPVKSPCPVPNVTPSGSGKVTGTVKGYPPKTGSSSGIPELLYDNVHKGK